MMLFSRQNKLPTGSTFSVDWVRDHSSRKNPRLPVIRLGSGSSRKGLLRYKAGEIEEFIAELERISARRPVQKMYPAHSSSLKENYGEKAVPERMASSQR